MTETPEATIARLTAELAEARASQDRLSELHHAATRDKNSFVAGEAAQKARADKAETERDAMVAAAESDKLGLMFQTGKLLRILDDWDKERADEHNGGFTMHTYGQTPDWYVEAAFWSCYGFAPDDPRSNTEKGVDFAANPVDFASLHERMTKFRERFCLASPGSDTEFKSFLEGFDAAADIVNQVLPSANVPAKDTADD